MSRSGNDAAEYSAWPDAASNQLDPVVAGLENVYLYLGIDAWSYDASIGFLELTTFANRRHAGRRLAASA